MTQVPLLLLLLASLASAQQYTITTIAGGSPPPTPSLATTVSIGDPSRVAVDTAGNVYFGSSHSIFVVDRTGTLTRLAGNGRPGYTDGAALTSQLTTPMGIAVDAQGVVFVADRDAQVVRRISGGTISTYAGSGAAGFFGDGGPARAARLNQPIGLALDSSGNLYIADQGNHCIRKVTPDGMISTFAGNAAVGGAYGGDNGPAANSLLNGPEGVATDSVGNVYIADTFNNRVRRVAVDGSISTIAGTGVPGPAGADSQPATSAPLFLPVDVTAGVSGVIYIADYGNNIVRKLSNGTLTRYAGNTGGIPPVDGQAATSVALSGPTGLAVDLNGNLYIAESSTGTGSGLGTGDYRVWQVTTAGVFHAYAGNGFNSFSPDGTPEAVAQFNVPAGLAFDAAGNLYIADSANNRIRRIGTDGLVNTVAGNGTAGFGGELGPAVSAQLNHPTGVVVRSDGGIFVADSGNNRVREILPNGIIGNYAGNGNAAYFGDGGPALAAAFHAPCALAVDSASNLYIADCLDFHVRKLEGGIVKTIAGNGTQLTTPCSVAGGGTVCPGDGGQAINAPLGYPDAIAVDAANNVYIGDLGSGQVRKVTPAGVITTLPGGAGPGKLDQLAGVRGVAVDTAGNVFVADSLTNQVRQITPNGLATIVAGTGACCYSGDGGPAYLAQLNQPWGLLPDGAGGLYIADAGNNAIRLLRPSTSTQPAVTAIVNAASNLAGAVAPGEVVVLYGSGMGPAQLIKNQPSGSFLGTQVGGTSVLFNGTPGPMVYSSAGQISAIVPYTLLGPGVQVVVQYQGQASEAVTVALAAAVPALFTSLATGSGQAAVINQDNSLNSAAHPAPVGSFISLYATGEGQTSPPGVDGKLASVPAPAPLLPVTVTIGNQTVAASYAGGVPTITAGLMQVNFQIPANTPAGAVPVFINVGGAASQAGVTIVVGTP